MHEDEAPVPVRQISRLCVEVPCVDDDVGVGRRVPLDPLHCLDGLKWEIKPFRKQPISIDNEYDRNV